MPLLRCRIAGSAKSITLFILFLRDDQLRLLAGEFVPMHFTKAPYSPQECHPLRI